MCVFISQNMSLQNFHDDFLEQMLFALQPGVSLPEISTITGDAVDQSSFLSTKLQQHQISTDDDAAALQQQLIFSRDLQATGDSNLFQNHTPVTSFSSIF